MLGVAARHFFYFPPGLDREMYFVWVLLERGLSLAVQ
jgi:hypothetical protein